DVLENIPRGAVQRGQMKRKEAEERGRELLARFGLGDREKEKPDRLSGGQQQRVALIRAFAPNPRALLLDEVTSALDPELVGEVLELVRELKAEGMTMLIATHEMGFAREVADRVAFLEDGRLLEVGPAARVIDSPSEPETRRFLGRLHQAGLT
ncbi:MAG: ATP-binding cassette domain-containing protein, partial [Solirubrobacterales bacterium]